MKHQKGSVLSSVLSYDTLLSYHDKHVVFIINKKKHFSTANESYQMSSFNSIIVVNIPLIKNINTYFINFYFNLFKH